MTMNVLKVSAVWLVLLAGFGCGGDDTAGDEAPLTDRDFLLESAEGFSAVPNTTVSLSFSENAEEGAVFRFRAGCNYHHGSYRWQGGTLIMEGFGSTHIDCGAELHAQDGWLADFFTSSPTMTLDGDTLSFEGQEATLVFLDREVADPDKPLFGQVWVVDTFISGGGAGNLSIVQDPTLEFDEDGSLEVFSGCNTGSGSWASDGDTLTLSNMAYTEIACAEAAQMGAESQAQAVLRDGELTFTIDASRLTLLRGELGLGAVVEP